MDEIKIEYISPKELEPYAKNSRTHSKEQVNQVIRSINEFGFTNPVLIKGKTILAGHCRIQAAKKIGLNKVPCLRLEHLSPEQARAYVIADNQLAMNAGWDDSILKEELESLLSAEFDISLVGFDDDFLQSLGVGEPDEVDSDGSEDKIPEVEENIHGVKRGDVWQLGNHRLMCGDSTDKADVEKLMDGEKADMVFTDPPYGVSYDGSWRELVGKPSNNQTIKNDDKFPLFLHHVQSPIVYVWFAATVAKSLLQQLEENEYEIKSMIVWRKPWSISKTFYNQVHEPCYYAVKKGAKQNWIGPDNDTTVWELPDFRTSKERQGDHPMEKPVALAFHAISNHDAPQVLDLFLGSGSTLIACEKTGRKCYGMELDEHYVSVIIERWQQFTGQKAELMSE